MAKDLVERAAPGGFPLNRIVEIRGMLDPAGAEG